MNPIENRDIESRVDGREAAAGAATGTAAETPPLRTQDSGLRTDGTRDSGLRTGETPGSGLTTFLTSPWLTIRVQLALGIFFVAAALPKIVDPPSFAHMMYNYRILPGSLINFMALTMPWVELLSGLALILGIWKEAARTIIAAMLLTFIVAISINLARGNAIDCGCFDPNPRPKSRAERIDDMRFVIYRDLGMLLMVGQLWWAGRREPA